MQPKQFELQSPLYCTALQYATTATTPTLQLQPQLQLQLQLQLPLRLRYSYSYHYHDHYHYTTTTTTATAAATLHYATRKRPLHLHYSYNYNCNRGYIQQLWVRGHGDTANTPDNTTPTTFRSISSFCHLYITTIHFSFSFLRHL